MIWVGDLSRTAAIVLCLLGCNVWKAVTKTLQEDNDLKEVTLKVHLSDASTHQPLGGATIELFANHTPVTTETSAADGNAYLRFPYRLGTLLVVTATRQGYVPNSAPWRPTRLPVFSSLSLELLPERAATLMVYEDLIQINSGSQGLRGQSWVQFQRRALSLPPNSSYSNLTALLTVANNPSHIQHFPYLQGLGGNGTDEVVTSHGPIEADKDNIRQEPYSLPQGFMWDTLDLSNADVLKELYTLLNENYVEDDDNMFRFDYSPNFLKWALRPPGWLPQWHCGVRVSSNKKLVGFISAIPADIHIYDTLKKMVEINFLCVHKKLRSKRVAPVLIREITRRVNLEGIFQAVYTAGVVLPKPVSTCRYWHRSLNPRKLVEVKFSHLSRNMTLQRTMKLYRLPDSTKTPGLRAMERRDVRQVTELLQKHMRRFQLAPSMGEEEVAHWFLPQDNIIDTFVVEGAGGVLTDFTSFYTLPSTVMHHPQHRSLKAAYSFYSVYTHVPLLDLMNDTLILAKLKGFDVFNALDLMENKVFLEKLKFGIGDGNLQYYLFNWKCPPWTPTWLALFFNN
ncbi:hypothetical protein J4Q44_G00025610 [Coregonus suidteri]|uniref:Glycylpeptide N-tetradecanoyltransferase n=1 Tax=Coregonus suidteri TaxID=861788 RepID=A0AAN8R6F7_9TELE